MSTFKVHSWLVQIYGSLFLMLWGVVFGLGLPSQLFSDYQQKVIDTHGDYNIISFINDNIFGVSFGCLFIPMGYSAFFAGIFFACWPVYQISVDDDGMVTFHRLKQSAPNKAVTICFRCADRDIKTSEFPSWQEALVRLRKFNPAISDLAT